jgi:hypothetical protein
MKMSLLMKQSLVHVDPVQYTSYKTMKNGASGMLRRVALVKTDVSEELSAF